MATERDILFHELNNIALRLDGIQHAIAGAPFEEFSDGSLQLGVSMLVADIAERVRDLMEFGSQKKGEADDQR